MSVVVPVYFIDGSSLPLQPLCLLLCVFVMVSVSVDISVCLTYSILFGPLY